MWLMNYITKNSIAAPKAEKGGASIVLKNDGRVLINGKAV